jgi:hypothetical protein
MSVDLYFTASSLPYETLPQNYLGLPGAGIEPAWGCPQGIFVLATAFAAARLRGVHLESGLYLCPVAVRDLGRGRQVSTLSAPLKRLGLARGCSHPCVDWFSDFDPIHTRRFRLGAQLT